MARDNEKYLEWKRSTLKLWNINLHRENDKDIIDFLETVPNKRQYILDLVRADMEKKEKALNI